MLVDRYDNQIDVLRDDRKKTTCHQDLSVNLFFGHAIDPLSLAGKVLAVLLAVLLGGLIGAERELHGSPAGMRTHILVCVGATVMTLTSVEIGLGVRGGMRGNPAHLAAQIVSGIGFLGAARFCGRARLCAA